MRLLKNMEHVRLGSVCQKIGSGATPRGGDGVYIDAGTSIIRSQNVYNGIFEPAGLAYLTEDHAEQLKGVTVESRDVLLNITGDSVARCCQVPDSVLPARVNQHVSIIRPNERELLPEFLCYYLISPLMQKYLLSRAGSGGTRKALTKGMIEDFEIPKPSIVTQRKVVDTLSAYDDLIENNRRRIALLEQAARLLYKEWFVHLRFPGHEHVKIKNGVPEGWEKKQVKAILAKVHRPGKVMKTDYLPAGLIPCVDQSQDFIGGYTDDEEAAIANLPMIVFGDHTRILKFIDFPFACGADGTQLIASNDAKISQEFLYFALDAIDLSNYFYARHFKFLKDQFIPRPNDMVVEQFTHVVRPIMTQVKTLREQNHELGEARDLLLPRLMNGEISV
ncbi:MAG: restriction endonuclease subunit S [Thermodesulfobacteriota bacterium]